MACRVGQRLTVSVVPPGRSRIGVPGEVLDLMKRNTGGQSFRHGCVPEQVSMHVSLHASPAGK